MTYFHLSTTDKIDILEEARTTLKQSPNLLEKDIHVVWALNALFDSPVGNILFSRVEHRYQKDFESSIGFPRISTCCMISDGSFLI